jgi:hypothetical protein
VTVAVAMTRALLVLLVARVIAAPLALRPAAAGGPVRDVVVLRVCAWPAPPPGGSAADASLNGGLGAVAAGLLRWPELPAAARPTLSSPADPHLGPFGGRAAGRLRC